MTRHSFTDGVIDFVTAHEMNTGNFWVWPIFGANFGVGFGAAITGQSGIALVSGLLAGAVFVIAFKD